VADLSGVGGRGGRVEVEFILLKGLRLRVEDGAGDGLPAKSTINIRSAVQK
jgi:hypothetical protein